MSVTVYFQHRVKKEGEPNAWTKTADQVITAPGSTPVGFEQATTGLSNGTTYEYRGACDDAGTIVYGEIVEFTTIAGGVVDTATADAKGISLSVYISASQNIDLGVAYAEAEAINPDVLAVTNIDVTILPASGVASAILLGVTVQENSYTNILPAIAEAEAVAVNVIYTWNVYVTTIPPPTATAEAIVLDVFNTIIPKPPISILPAHADAAAMEIAVDAIMQVDIELKCATAEAGTCETDVAILYNIETIIDTAEAFASAVTIIVIGYRPPLLKTVLRGSRREVTLIGATKDANWMLRGSSKTVKFGE